VYNLTIECNYTAKSLIRCVFAVVWTP